MQIYSKNYYEILNIPCTASQDEIKHAYKELCKQYHPDITNHSDEMMKEINEAYSVLSKPSEKEKYDIWYSETFISTKYILAFIFDDKELTIREVRYNMDSFSFDIDKYIDNTGHIYIIHHNANETKNNIIYTKSEWSKKIEFLTMYKLFVTKEIADKDDSFFQDISDWNGMSVQQYKQFLEIKFENLLNKQQRNKTASGYNHQKEQKKESIIALHIIELICIMVFVSWLFMELMSSRHTVPSSYSTSSHTNSVRTVPTPTPTPTPSLPPEVEVPYNGFTNYSYKKNSRYNTLVTFKTEDDSYNDYYYIKFYDTKDNSVKKDVFLHSGEDATIVIPCGDYYIKYVCGNTWYGYDYYFCNNHCYALEDTDTNSSVHNFSNDYTYTYTLYGVYDGNIETQELSISDF